MRKSTAQNQIPRRKSQSRPTAKRDQVTVRQIIRENPLVATMTVFGAGLAVGSVVGSMLADVGFSTRPTLTDRVQRRVNSVLTDMIPSSLEERLHG